MEEFQLGANDFENPEYEKPNKFDEKEIEKRKKIAEDIANTGIIEDANVLYKLSKKDATMQAFEYHIPLSRKEYDELMDTLRYMNNHVKNAFGVFDSYITFSHENPSSENMSNLILNFTKFIKKERHKPFHHARLEEEHIHYFRNDRFNEYILGIISIIDGMQGLLIRAGKYIMDAENESRQGSDYNYDRFGGFGGYRDYNNFGYPSMNEYRYGMKHPTYNAKFNIPKRQFGDEYDINENENGEQ